MRFLLLLLIIGGIFQPPPPEDCPPSRMENRYGVVAHLSWRFLYDEMEMTRAVEMMEAAGIGWVRLNWSWKDMQPEAGDPFNYTQFDLAARLTAENGIQLMPILFSIPAWAGTAPPELIAEKGSLAPVDRYRPADWETWRTYVQNVVERYDGDGIDDAPGSPRISHWEVWNEPNIALYFPPAPNAQEYLDLLKLTHDTVMQADPTATIILGGMAGTGVNEEGTGFIQQLYDLGAADYFDVVSIHIYVYPGEGAVEAVQERVAFTRAVMDDHGDSEKPLFLSEIGWSDAPNAWGQPTVPQEDIAAFLREVYTAPLPADVIFWYNFRNIFDDSADVEHNFGLVYNSFAPKPAYLAYQEVAAACR